MPQFFPDGPSAVNLNNISEQGGINVPPEFSGMYDTPGMQGSMQQLLSENLGRYVMADFLVGVSNIVRRVGILYSVGRSFLVLYLEDYHVFQVCDIFSLKFISFFAPGSEPTLEQLMSGEFTSGILSPGTGGVLRPNSGAGGIFGDNRTTGSGSMGGMNMGGGMNGMGMNGSMGSTGMGGGNNMRTSGSRTLGQR